MKKLLLLSGLLLLSCAKPATVIVKVPAPVVSQKAPSVYLMCSGKLFKAVIISINNIEAVYRCPDESYAK